MAAGGSLYDDLERLLERESLKDIRTFLNKHKARISLQQVLSTGQTLFARVEGKNKQIQKLFKEVLADQYAAIARNANAARARNIVAANEARRAEARAAAEAEAAAARAVENAARAERNRAALRREAEFDAIRARTEALDGLLVAYVEGEGSSHERLDEIIALAMRGILPFKRGKYGGILEFITHLSDADALYVTQQLLQRLQRVNPEEYNESELYVLGELNQVLNFIGNNLVPEFPGEGYVLKYYLAQELLRHKHFRENGYTYKGKKISYSPELITYRNVFLRAKKRGNAPPAPVPAAPAPAPAPEPEGPKHPIEYIRTGDVKGFKKFLEANPTAWNEFFDPIPGFPGLSLFKVILRLDPSHREEFISAVYEAIVTILNSDDAESEDKYLATEALDSMWEVGLSEANISVLNFLLRLDPEKLFNSRVGPTRPPFGNKRTLLDMIVEKLVETGQPVEETLRELFQDLPLERLIPHYKSRLFNYVLQNGYSSLLPLLASKNIRPETMGPNFPLLIEALLQFPEETLATMILPAFTVEQWNTLYGRITPFQWILTRQKSLFSKASKQAILELLLQRGVNPHIPHVDGLPTSALAHAMNPAFLTLFIELPQLDLWKELEALRQYTQTPHFATGGNIDDYYGGVAYILQKLSTIDDDPEELLTYLGQVPNALNYRWFIDFKQEQEKRVRAKKPYTGYRQAELRLLDKLLISPVDLSICPICLSSAERTMGCLYMRHDCRASGFYHEALYEKYKDAEGKITWCTMCSRIGDSYPTAGGMGHRHYRKALVDDAKPGYAPIQPGQTENPFDRDCVTQGGGGLLEKFARMRRLREYAFELQEQVGAISDYEARTQLVEEVWNSFVARQPAARKVLNRAQNIGVRIFKAAEARAGAGGDLELTPEEVDALDAIWTAAGQVPTAKFLANNTMTAANRAALNAQQAENARLNAEARQNLRWPFSGNASRQPIRATGECPVCLEEKDPLWIFGHPAVGTGAGAAGHEPICEDCLRNAIINELGSVPVTASIFGKCWSTSCTHELWPEELAGKIPEDLLERYRIAFNKHKILQARAGAGAGRGGGISNTNLKQMPFLNPNGAPEECSLPRNIRSGGRYRQTRKRVSKRRKTRKA